MKRTFAIQQFLMNCKETYLIGPMHVNHDCGECLLLPNFGLLINFNVYC